MSVKLYKLSCGDLIIAEEFETTPDSVRVLRPLRMLIGDKGISLMMWCPCDLDEPTTINRAHLVTESVAVAPLAAEYKGKFGGIVTPEAPKLVVPG